VYKIYIKNFMRNGSLITTEEQMFAVPSVSGFPVQKPIVKASEDAAENFTFSMESNSPYYDALLQHKTLIRVVYDGPNGTDTDVIFDGKVLNISSSTVYHTKNVTCAGYYVFFNDSYYEGKQEKFRNKISVSDYYTAIVNNHNAMVPEKAVTKGSVGVELPSELDRYEPTSWTQTSGLLSNLTSNYGGHMIVQSSGNTRTLNWYKYYARDLGDGLRPKVTVGKNILDISADYTGDNVFTRVIPIGSTDNNGKTIYIDGYNNYSGKSMSVPYIRNLYTDQELTDEFHSYTDYRDAETNFGVIYKTVTFSDADTQEKLWNYVKKWIKDSYFGIATSFTVKAIDLHITDNNYPKILIGECVDVTYLIVRNGTPTWETKKLVCRNISYDLFNPENNSYTFSIPSDLLEHSKTSKKSSRNQTASANGSKKTIPKGNEDKELTWHKIWQIIGSERPASDYGGTNAALSFYGNGELKGTAACFDPTEMAEATPVTGEPPIRPINHKDLWFKASIVGKITLPGKTVKWVGTSADRGVFAFEFSNGSVLNGGASPVTHWYLKEKGYTYEQGDSGISSFDTIVDLIKKDTTVGWGGDAAANSFKSNGKISGSINKVYDPDKCTKEEAQADSKLVFSAEIVGKITISGASTKYVAISKEFGIFGYTSGDRGYIPATHWYSRAKGLTYDNVSGFIAEAETGNVYATTTGDVDEKKSVWLKTRELTGYGSAGEVLVGIDTTAQGDQWRIQLNTPFQYKDADGVTRIADGFVSASDFRVSEIPSFKTKIGIFDIVIAGKVEANTISADLAEVRKWLGSTISADTGIRTDKLWANRVSATTYAINVPSEGGSGYDTGYLNNCFSNCLVYSGTGDDSGKIFFDFYKIGGGIGQTVNFNIADTQFYKDAVSAAKLSGWGECFTSFSALGTTASKTLSYGESAVVNVTQKRADGTVATRLERTYTAPSDRYSSGWSDCYTSFSATGTTASKTLDYGESAVVNVTQKRADGTVATRLERTYTAPSSGGSGTIDIQTRNQGGCGLYSTTLPVAYTYHELYTWVNSSTTPNPKTAKYVTFVVTCGNADKRYYCIDLSRFR